MVNIRWKYVIGILSAVVLALVCGGAFWLLATTAGARWLVGEVIRRADQPLSVAQVDGSLSDTLVLAGIDARYPEMTVELERLKLSWRPGALLRGKVLVTRLETQGLTVTTLGEPEKKEPKETDFELQWPDLPAWLHRIRAEVRRFELRQLVLKSPDQEPQKLDGVSGRITWTGEQLEISSLAVTGPPGTLEASLRARWPQRRLRLEAAARMQDIAGGEARADLLLDLHPAKGETGLAGELRVDAFTLPTGKLQLTVRPILTADTLSLQDLELRQVEDRGRINGHLRLGLKGEAPEVEADLTLTSVDLARLADQATDISGSLRVTGRIDDYRGRFDLANRAEDWRSARLAATFSGNTGQVVLSDLTGSLLKGQLGGELTAAWQPEISVKGRLAGDSLNPGVYDPEWPGKVNFEFEGHWQQPEEGPMDLAVRGRLLESTLRGYGFRGRIDARLQGTDELTLNALELQGEGVDLTAQGALHRRVDYRVRVEDLATLLPEASGALQSSGWLRWRDKQLTGTARGTGRQLRYQDILAGEVGFSARLAGNESGEVNLRLRQLQVGDLAALDADLEASGTLKDHRASGSVRLPRDTTLELALAGGYRQQTWQGTLQRLALRDPVGPWRLQQPVAVVLSPQVLNFKELRMAGTGKEELTAEADLQLKDITGRLHLQWREVRLARIDPWLKAGRVGGRTSGRAALNRSAGGENDLSLHVELSGRYAQDDLELNLTGARGDLEWNRQGLLGTLVADLARGIHLEGRVRSEEPAGTALPSRGGWELTWNGLNLRHLEPWLPPGVVAQGQVFGQSRGTWAPEGVLTAQGSASLAQGKLEAPVAQTLVSFPLETADVSWDWQGSGLEARTSLVLAERGRLAGTARLPLPARLPIALDPGGRLSGRVEGTVREQGLVAVLFPGLVRETRGKLELDVNFAGTWRHPDLGGWLKLSEAGAFLPAAGIELKEIGLEAALDKDRVDLTAFSVKSGDGQISGTGSLQMRQWQIAEYRATLAGERFELIHLPELQALVSPRLELQGTTERLAVKGTVRVPELLIREIEREAVLLPSEDVVIVGEEAPPEKPAPMSIRSDVDVILGDHVLVKMAGLDARLTGKLNVKAAGLEDIRGYGRISVAEGDYRAYGAKLKIERGNLLFSGPVEQPTLDILALRTVGEIKAGVRVTGTARSPVVELYSDPAMSDTDRLGYIVLGHPFARDGGEANLMMTAAGALLGQGESVVLQDRLKRTLGVDVLGFEAGNGDVSESMLTIGKYLNPDLYVSIGQSLFTETTEFRVRYSLGEHWQVQSSTGTESGVDLFYKIEFR